MFICNSLPTKFIVEIDGNAIVVIYVDLISCLLKVECYIFSWPTSFLQKSSCRVSSKKNILNSSVEWSRVESCGVEKLDKSYIFVYFLTHFLFIINTVIRGAHDNWYTHVRYTEISKFDLLFFVYQYQYGHTRCAWYTHVRSMGISNFNLLRRLMGVRIIDFNF